VEIRLPPLRDRREDIPLLLEHFRAKFNDKFKKNIAGVSADVLKAFSRYSWPGNVRELEHAMEHAFVLCNQNIITYDHLPPDFMRIPGMRRSSTEAQGGDSGETLAALNNTAWNKAKAARLLGIDRVTLYRRIKKFNLIEMPPRS
jgi:DNA-binding NtrC family response regulator